MTYIVFGGTLSLTQSINHLEPNVTTVITVISQNSPQHSFKASGFKCRGNKNSIFNNRNVCSTAQQLTVCSDCKSVSSQFTLKLPQCRMPFHSLQRC